MLRYVEVNLSSNSSPWSGRIHTLRSHTNGGVAVLHVIADRWLPYFEYVLIGIRTFPELRWVSNSEWANPDQLERLARILVNVDLASVDTSLITGLSASVILKRTLRDAQFWELLRIRGTSYRLLLHECNPHMVEML